MVPCAPEFGAGVYISYNRVAYLADMRTARGGGSKTGGAEQPKYAGRTDYGVEEHGCFFCLWRTEGGVGVGVSWF